MDVASRTIGKWWQGGMRRRRHHQGGEGAAAGEGGAPLLLDAHTGAPAEPPVFTRVLSDGSGAQAFGAQRLAAVVERTHPELLPLNGVELRRLGKAAGVPGLRERVGVALSNASDPITLDEPPQAPVFRHTCPNGLVMGFDARALCAYMRASGSFTNPVNTAETFSPLDVWCIGELARDPALVRDVQALKTQKLEADERRSVLEFLERDAAATMQRLLDEATSVDGGGAPAVLRRILELRAPDVYECLSQVSLSFSAAQAREVCSRLADQARAAEREPYAHYPWVYQVAHDVLRGWRRRMAAFPILF
jgi:hypothetical protein